MVIAAIGGIVIILTADILFFTQHAPIVEQ